MAIVFVQQNKKQKILIFILVSCLVLTGLVLWLGFFSPSQPSSQDYITENTENTDLSSDEIEIEFDVLKNPLLKELQPFSEIQPLENSTSTGGKGRQNPFLPY
jgi:hypothetical protein